MTHGPDSSPARRRCAAVLLTSGSNVLLGKRSIAVDWHPGRWDVIGGHVETGESDESAAVREVHEELGVDVRVDDLSQVGTADGDGYELVVFAATTWSGTPRNVEPHAHDEIGWFGPDELSRLDLTDRAIVDLAAAAIARPPRTVRPERG